MNQTSDKIDRKALVFYHPGHFKPGDIEKMEEMGFTCISTTDPRAVNVATRDLQEVFQDMLEKYVAAKIEISQLEAELRITKAMAGQPQASGFADLVAGAGDAEDRSDDS